MGRTPASQRLSVVILMILSMHQRGGIVAADSMSLTPASCIGSLIRGSCKIRAEPWSVYSNWRLAGLLPAQRRSRVVVTTNASAASIVASYALSARYTISAGCIALEGHPPRERRPASRVIGALSQHRAGVPTPGILRPHPAPGASPDQLRRYM